VGLLPPQLIGPRLVPRIDLCLQILALRQQRRIFRRELAEQRREIGPETVLVQPRAGKRLRFDEIDETGIDGQAVAVEEISHV